MRTVLVALAAHKRQEGALLHVVHDDAEHTGYKDDPADRREQHLNTVLVRVHHAPECKGKEVLEEVIAAVADGSPGAGCDRCRQPWEYVVGARALPTSRRCPAHSRRVR